MATRPNQHRLAPALWPLVLVALVAALFAITAAMFSGAFRSFVPVTLTAERAGLVMESDAKVRLNGVEVGRVASIAGVGQQARLELHLDSDEVKNIPANVGAQINATTAFGAKFVDLIYPKDPSPNRISAGTLLVSRNVTVEVNTVFENLTAVLDKVDPAKLNAVLSAIAEAVRGQGERIGQATTDANQVLLAVNPRMDQLDQNWKSFKSFNDAYAAAAKDVLRILDAASTTSATITKQSESLDALLLNVTGFAHSGTDLIAPNQANLIEAINVLRPTTDLLLKYNPEYTCLLVGSKWWLDHGGYSAVGGNGRTVLLDAALLLGTDPYKYPENLPIVNARGGPGGKPGCGSLPDATKNYPVRQLITDTGFGTGLDFRPNPGIGFPGWANYFPVTRAVPESPVIRNTHGGPAPGPPPAYLGGPAYNAPEFGPDGTPLYPPPPGAPAPPPVLPAAPMPVEPPGAAPPADTVLPAQQPTQDEARPSDQPPAP